jgi:NTE family protein
MSNCGYQAKQIVIIALFISLLGCGHNPVHIATPSQPPVPKVLPEIRVALVLSGGGSKGVAHAGVISVLEAYQVPIDLIVGTSAGSVVGALYADAPNSALLKNKLLKTKKKELLDFNVLAMLSMVTKLGGAIEGYALRAYLLRELQHTYLEDLPIPLVVVTTDINAGKTFTLRSGPIIPAIHASSAVPLMFKPVKIYGKTLVDGGVVSPLPIEVARQYQPRLVIAVDVGYTFSQDKVLSNYQLLSRSLWLSYANLAHWQGLSSDILIHPNTNAMSMFNDNEHEQLFHMGREAALAAMPQIQAKLKQQGITVRTPLAANL